ncbi:MAG: phosphohydrolase [Dysgonamonadaceae bacterium]|nr:phosphohydrolase [Dysgonamonadaceae bacterium]MDD4728457.1 phosphohydrolase [Dysgonamonadaceae bacterium]
MNPHTIIEKYYTKGTKLYDIYISHVTDVTNKALLIAQKHPELAIDVQFLEEAGMLHDIGIFMTKAPHIACKGNHPYICHGYLGRDLLTEEGFPQHGLVCERHTGTGLSLETIVKRKLPIPHRNMQPQSMEEQIICFADKFFSKSKLGKEKSIKKIRSGLGKHGVHQIKKFDEWCNLFL